MVLIRFAVDMHEHSETLCLINVAVPVANSLLLYSNLTKYRSSNSLNAEREKVSETQNLSKPSEHHYGALTHGGARRGNLDSPRQVISSVYSPTWDTS